MNHYKKLAIISLSVVIVLTSSACSRWRINNTYNETDTVNRARQAYWNGDVNTSIHLYRTLIRNNPNSIDYKGELANIYVLQNNPIEAGRLYADIVPALLNSGRMAEVRDMKVYIEQADPAFARALVLP